jgi:hypothetical protein
MSDEIFEYKLRTTAEGSGAKETAQGLDKVADSAKKFSEASKEAAQSATEDAKHTEEQTKQTGFLSLKKTELKKLVRELGHEFPIAGMAARAMMNPIVAAFTGAIAIFGYAKQKLEEWNQALDAAAERNASKDFLPGIEAKKDALGQAATSAAEFATSLANVGKAEDKFKTSVSQAIDKLHEFINAQAEVNSAGEAKELAEVDLKQKTGKLDEVGAIKQRTAIRQRYRKAQDDLKTKGEQDEIKLEETELEHDKDSQISMVAAAADARKKRDALKARRAQAQKDLEQGKKKEAEYEQEFGAAAEAVDSGPRGLNASPWDGGQGRGNDSAAAVEKLEEARRQRDAQRKFNKANEDLINKLDQSQLPDAEGAASVADARAKSNAERVNELERTLPGKREVVGIREKGREVAGGLKDQTGGIEAAAQIAGELAQGQAKEAQLQEQVARSVESGTAVRVETLNALKAVIKHDQELTAELKALTQRMESHDNSRKLSPPGT